MYTILITNTDRLITTLKHNFIQGSKCVYQIKFLTPLYYYHHDMSEYSAVLKYVLPGSANVITKPMKPSDELHHNHLEYIVDLDENFTLKTGNVKMHITFYSKDIDEDGNPIKIRETFSTNVKIYSQSNSGNPMDNDDDNEQNYVDNLTLEGDQLQLTSDGKKIGDPVTVLSPNNSDGLLKVIDF